MKLMSELIDSLTESTVTKVGGGIIKVEHGHSYSAILHPEHQAAIKKLKSGESTHFKDEQGVNWRATRGTAGVHLQGLHSHSSKSLHMDLSHLGECLEESVKIPTPNGYKKVGVREFKKAEAEHSKDIDHSTRNSYGIVSHSKRGRFVGAKHFAFNKETGVHSTETYSHADHKIPGVIHKSHVASGTHAYFVGDK